jgi:hypothetical protein
VRAVNRLDLPPDGLGSFCRRWKVLELALFGSALREDFRPESDVDLLVTFASDAHWTLLDLVHMENELAGLLNRRVELVERAAVEGSENYIRRAHILRSAEPIYVEG